MSLSFSASTTCFIVRCPPLDCRLVSAVPSVVLPILGAVPDGMLKPQVVVSRCASMVCKEMVRILLVRMVLFSGLGPDAQNQAVDFELEKNTGHKSFSGSLQVSVGVGALAGSTVMLLTLPWSVAESFDPRSANS